MLDEKVEIQLIAAYFLNLPESRLSLFGEIVHELSHYHIKASN